METYLSERVKQIDGEMKQLRTQMAALLGGRVEIQRALDYVRAMAPKEEPVNAE